MSEVKPGNVPSKSNRPDPSVSGLIASKIAVKFSWLWAKTVEKSVRSLILRNLWLRVISHPTWIWNAACKNKRMIDFVAKAAYSQFTYGSKSSIIWPIGKHRRWNFHDLTHRKCAMVSHLYRLCLICSSFGHFDAINGWYGLVSVIFVTNRARCTNKEVCIHRRTKTRSNFQKFFQNVDKTKVWSKEIRL